MWFEVVSTRFAKGTKCYNCHFRICQWLLDCENLLEKHWGEILLACIDTFRPSPTHKLLRESIKWRWKCQRRQAESLSWVYFKANDPHSRRQLALNHAGLLLHAWGPPCFVIDRYLIIRIIVNPTLINDKQPRIQRLSNRWDIGAPAVVHVMLSCLGAFAISRCRDALIMAKVYCIGYYVSCFNLKGIRRSANGADLGETLTPPIIVINFWFLSSAKITLFFSFSVFCSWSKVAKQFAMTNWLSWLKNQWPLNWDTIWIE